MIWSAGMLRVAICLPLFLCGALGMSTSWAAGYYFPPSPSSRYITLSAPLFPTSPEACDALQQEFSDIQQELSAQHDQCLRDAPDQEHGDDGGTCSKSSCQSLHTARDQAGKYAQQEVGLCRRRLNDHLTEQRRRDERARRDAEEADRDRRDHERRDQERDRDRRHTEQREQLDRERQAAQEKADRERRDAEDRAERERQDARDRAARGEQQRQQVEALRQAHFRAVTQAAAQLKTTWTDRIKNGLPEVAAGLVELMQVASGVARGNGSYKLADLVVAADTLFERSQSASKWITSPLQSSVDHVMGDAVDMVRADPAYQRSDARLQTIFRGIKSVNELAHDTNPFTKAISGAAFDQIDNQVKGILGELEHLESEVGSFNHSNRTYADQPIANPFKGTPPKQTASTVETENPFRRPSAVRAQEAAPSTDTAPSFNTDTTNPFRIGGSGSDNIVTAPNPTQTTKQPQTTRCPKDGLGVVTEPCKKRSQVQGPSKATR